MTNYRVMIEIEAGECDNPATAAQVAIDKLTDAIKEHTGVYMHVIDTDTSWSDSGVVQVADDGKVDAKDLLS